MKSFAVEGGVWLYVRFIRIKFINSILCTLRNIRKGDKTLR